MAVCSKCGAGIPPESSSCPVCGAPVQAAAASPQQPFAPVAPSAPPMYGQPGYAPPPPTKSSGGTLKIVLIVLAVIVGLGVLGLGAIGFVGWRAMHAMNSNGNSIKMGKNADVSEADLGVAVYPGAVKKEAGGMKIKTATNMLVSSMYTTADPEPQVLDFYRDKLGADATETQSGRGSTLTSAKVDGEMKDSVMVTVTPSPQADSGTTNIMILHSRTVKK